MFKETDDIIKLGKYLELSVGGRGRQIIGTGWGGGVGDSLLTHTAPSPPAPRAFAPGTTTGRNSGTCGRGTGPDTLRHPPQRRPWSW